MELEGPPIPALEPAGPEPRAGPRVPGEVPVPGEPPAGGSALARTVSMRWWTGLALALLLLGPAMAPAPASAEPPPVTAIAIDGILNSLVERYLRAALGGMILDDGLARREQINEALRSELDEITDRWGVKVTAVEIREITPPREIQEAMTRQMSAERTRRTMVLEADGRREAARSAHPTTSLFSGLLHTP
jgi:hypothetical protein